MRTMFAWRGLVGLVGAGVLVLGCKVSVDDGDPDDDYGTGGSGGSGASGAGGSMSSVSSGGSGGTAGSGGNGGSGGGTTGGEMSSAAGGSGGNAGASGEADDTPPVLALVGDPVLQLDCGEEFVDPGVTTSDDSGGDVVVEVTPASLTTDEPGEYEVSYVGEDEAGNTTEVSREVFVCGPACGDLGRELINLSPWTGVQYEFNDQPDAVWTAADDGFSVVQSVNADASILLSNFDATDLEIQGSWLPGSSSDDDYIGFVFGYQDRGHYYLFDWKQVTQDDADQGMALKVVAVAPGDGGEVIDPTIDDLWPTAGSANVHVLELDGEPLHNDVGWVEDEEYAFFLEFHPGSFKLEVYDSAETQLVSWSVEDDTYAGGQFGFYNYSQAPVTYQSFTQRKTPRACSTVGDD